MMTADTSAADDSNRRSDVTMVLRSVVGVSLMTRFFGLEFEYQRTWRPVSLTHGLPAAEMEQCILNGAVIDPSPLSVSPTT